MEPETSANPNPFQTDPQVSPNTSVSQSNEEIKLPDKKNKRFGMILIFFATLIFLISLIFLYQGRQSFTPIDQIISVQKLEVKKFSTDAEFKNHLSGSSSSAGYFGRSSLRALEGDVSMAPGASIGNAGISPSFDIGSPQRISETNVQVKGIDEPDILKSDGENIYYSISFAGYYPMPAIDVGIVPERERIVPVNPNSTKVIKAFPPQEISKLSDIQEMGEMLLFEDILFTFSGKKFSGYNVTDPVNPLRKWTQELEGNTRIVTARKFKDKLYLVAQTYVYSYSPCPIPLIKGGLSIACTDIYYPPMGNSSDTTYTILIINPDDGSVENRATFLANSSVSVVYMSQNYIYISFTYYESYVDFILGFLKSEGEGIVSAEVIANLEKISGYEISDEAKMIEFTKIFENYMASLTDDERKKLENEMQNKAEDYLKEHARDLEKTGIARFDAANLQVTSSEAIPGSPLNQFSLDEYQGNLRVATTTSNSFTGSSDTFNDVYIMDSEMRVSGKIIDLGLTERIYSARFVEDRGYLVTFRQIDPFYVLDLSDPKNPKMTGELKIPGYSSYLHPLAINKILGVGMEGNNAKVSLFDVSDPSNPKEISKYDMAEFWSDVSSNHHAFLQDERHSIFFMPAGQNGYIFSYNNDVINLKKVVTGIRARRAMYLDDYLYILGDSKMVVLNENDWEEVASYDYL